MTEPDLHETTPTEGLRELSAEGVQPSWTPLYWFVGALTVLIVLGEFFLDIVLEVIETLRLVLIEAPEEMLEDLLADWLKQHFPQDAHRYSEVTTAIGLTPLKIVLILLAVRWGWRYGRRTLWPRLKRWTGLRYLEVRLAWGELAWPYRLLAGLILLGLLVILI